MASLRFGVRATDFLTFSVVALQPAGVAFAAAATPARPAVTVDPMGGTARPVRFRSCAGPRRQLFKSATLGLLRTTRKKTKNAASALAWTCRRELATDNAVTLFAPSALP
jgi:hypothetical protein